MAEHQRRFRLLLFISFLAFVSLGLPDGLLGVAWPSISSTFDRSLSRLAVLQLALTGGFFFSSVNAGRLIEKLGVGYLLIFSNVIIAFALTGYIFAGRWYLVVASTVVLGSGGGAVDAGLNGYASVRFSKEQVTMLHAFYGFGAMLGPAMMREVLQSGAPWRYGYVVTLALVVALLAVFVLMRKIWYEDEEAESGGTREAGSADIGDREPESWDSSEAPPEGKAPRDISRRDTSSAQKWLGVALFLVYTGVEVTVGAWSFTFLTAGRGVEASTAALWVGAFWATFTGGRLFFGLFGRRWSTHGVVDLMLAASLAGALLLLQTWSELGTFIALPILGFAFAPLFPFFVTLTPHIVGRKNSPRIIGFQVAAANIGSAFIPLCVGAAVELVSLEAVAYMVVLLTIVQSLFYRMWQGSKWDG